MSTRRRRTEPVRAGRTTAWLLATVFAGSLWGGATEATVLPQGPTVAGSTGRPGATFSYTPNTLTINQSASRVVIDWNSFNIGVGGTVTFAQASPTWIAFNRVNINPDTGLSPLSSILGTLHATGGVWLFSSGGIIFGSDAVVDVGSFAGVTGPLSAAGGISQLLNPGVTGITTITLDPPSAAGLETITVDPGARIGAASGFVVLQSESMIQNGAVSASDGAEYLVSERGQISFTNTGSSQQLQGAQAMVVAGQDRPSLTLGGATTAAWVGIDTPGGALQRGYHELINLDGVIDATGVKPGSADDGVVLLVGDDLGPAAPGYTGSSIGINAAGGTMDAVNGISISTDSAQLGRVRAGGSLDVDTYGDVTTTAPISVGGGALIDSAAGSVALNADITADGLIYVAANAITVGRDVTLHSDALGAGQGGIVLSSAGDITADPTSNLVAGASAGDPDDPVSIRAGSGASGGNIVLGGAWGTEVFVQSQSHGVATQGSITLAGEVDGVDGVNVLINNAEAAGAPAGDLRILGDVASGGVVDVEDTGSGAMVVGSGASLTSSGSQVFLYSGGNTTVSSGAKVTGVSVLDYTVGTLTIAPGAAVATTGSTAAPIAPVIPSGSDFQRASGLNLAAGNMVIGGSVAAGTPSAPDDIYIEVLGPAGATAVIGGAGGGTGFDLSNASFGNLHGRDIVIMGGPGEASGPGESLQIQDLTLNSANLSALWLGTASSQSITVPGTVSPTGGAPVDVQIGFVRLGPGGSYSGGQVTDPGEGGLDGFIPGNIEVTGALGSATAPLGAVDLIARDNILMGDQGFVAAAQANPNFNAATSSGAYPGYAPGQAFVAAQTLQLAAQGRIVQQNTAGNGALFGGLDVGAPTSALPLIYVPAVQGQSISGGVWTADYNTGPSQIALFGAFVTPGGTIDDQEAAAQPNLLSGQISNRSAYEINTCVFTASCASPTSALTFEPPALLDVAALVEGTISAEIAAVLAQAASPDIFSVLTGTALPLQQDADRLGLTNPIIEIGNGDMWTGQGDCPPRPDGAKGCGRQ